MSIVFTVLFILSAAAPVIIWFAAAWAFTDLLNKASAKPAPPPAPKMTEDERIADAIRIMKIYREFEEGDAMAAAAARSPR
jgi:hypothetical protein